MQLGAEKSGKYVTIEVTGGRPTLDIRVNEEFRARNRPFVGFAVREDGDCAAKPLVTWHNSGGHGAAPAAQVATSRR
jgi:hypothetical protein